nr:tonB-system energizer ExbB [Rhodoplanes tepidamans]
MLVLALVLAPVTAPAEERDATAAGDRAAGPAVPPAASAPGAAVQDATPAAAPTAAPTPVVQGPGPADATAPADAAVPGEPAVSPPAVAVEPGTLPRDLSPWGMFLAADIVVKIVMAGLAAASVLTWTVFAAKTMEFRGERRRLATARAALPGIVTFADAGAAFDRAGGTAAALAAAAATEVALSHGLAGDGIKERVGLVLSQRVADAVRRMRRGLGAVATVGATAPFVGLFGTVWGIMNSFVGISRAQTTNLAVVAPGIAEALLATALGLFAAIPAVVIYNAASRGIAGQRAALDGLATEILRVVGRDLDRAGQTPGTETAGTAARDRGPVRPR